MYCPVYGCTSDSQNNSDKLSFFEFPKATENGEKKRRAVWIDFCKRKNFVPTKCTRMCSLHFSSDAYVPSHSPEFLKSLNFFGKRKVLLQPDAVPTQNKVFDTIKEKESATESKRRQTGTLSRKKVSVISQLKFFFLNNVKSNYLFLFFSFGIGSKASDCRNRSC